MVGKVFGKVESTSFIPDSDYGAPSNPHALRIDHGGAQKSCNGAIYRRASLLQNIPKKNLKKRQDLWEI